MGDSIFNAIALLVVTALLALIVLAVWGVVITAQSRRECLDLGYAEAVAYTDGSIYCRRLVGGTTDVLRLKGPSK